MSFPNGRVVYFMTGVLVGLLGMGFPQSRVCYAMLEKIPPAAALAIILTMLILTIRVTGWIMSEGWRQDDEQFGVKR